MKRMAAWSIFLASFLVVLLMSNPLVLSDPLEQYDDYVVIGWNDLGMHCMDHDYSVFGILPPYNNLHAQIIERKTGKLVGAGYDLFYGGVQCEACHGPTHCEYPTSEPNDNVQSVLLQGYQGTIRECSVCHIKKGIPITKDGGSHGLHTIGQVWVYSHTNDAKNYPQYCTTCHGMDDKGTFLSKVPTERIFHTTGSAKKIYSLGQIVSCYDCHTKL